MQDRTATELSMRAFADLKTAEQMDELAELEARARLRKQMKQMIATKEINILSEEEENMIHSFRRFKTRMRKNGQVFTWQTRMPEGVQVVDDSALVLHPNEV
jgi:Zn-dependent metalloprotease